MGVQRVDGVEVDSLCSCEGIVRVDGVPPGGGGGGDTTISPDGVTFNNFWIGTGALSEISLTLKFSSGITPVQRGGCIAIPNAGTYTVHCMIVVAPANAGFSYDLRLYHLVRNTNPFLSTLLETISVGPVAADTTEITVFSPHTFIANDTVALTLDVTAGPGAPGEAWGGSVLFEGMSEA